MMFKGIRLRRAIKKLSTDDRYEAVEKLGELGDPLAIEPLVKLFETETYYTDAQNIIHDEIIKALVKIGDPRAVKPLIKWLKFKNFGIRINVIRALDSFNDSRAVEPLIKMLGDTVFRCDAAEVLAKLGEPRWQEYIKGDNEDFARLAQSGDPRAYEPLIMAIEHEDIEMSRAAVNALGILGNPQAVNPLINILGNHNYKMRIITASVLARLGEPKWKEYIKGDTGDFIRLGQSGDPRAYEALIRALQGKNPCIAVIEALGKSGSKCAAEPLIELLKRGGVGYDICKAVIKWLSILGDSRAIDPLISELNYSENTHNSKDIGVRAAAIKALAVFNNPVAIDPLINALGDRNGQIRIASARALEKLGEPKWKKHIKGDDGDFDNLSSFSLVAEDGRVMKILEAVVDSLVRDLENPNCEDRKKMAKKLVDIISKNSKLLDDYWRKENIKKLFAVPHHDKESYVPSHDCFDSSIAHEDRGMGVDPPFGLA